MRLIRRDPNCGYLDTWLWVPKRYLNVDGTKASLTFTFTDTFSQRGRIVYLWKETDYHLLVPRSFWDVRNVPYRVVDLRPTSFPSVNIKSHIKLDHREQLRNGRTVLEPTGDDVQAKSLDALLNSSGGVLQLACGKGKTCVALELITRRGMPGLVVVPDTTLMEQWQKEITKLLKLKGGLGLIQADVFKWRHPIVLTTYHTIGARATTLSEEVLRWFGTIVWDEGHHIPAPTFASSAEAFYGARFSLTATPERDDGLHIISEYHIGPIVYRDLSQDLKPTVLFKWTGLEVDMVRDGSQILDKNGQPHLGKLSGFFGRWPKRVRMLLDDVAEALRQGRKVLVLSNSEGEIANLAALWESKSWKSNTTTELFTDIPIPSPMDVGETVMPAELTKADVTRKHLFIEKVIKKLTTANISQRERDKLNAQLVQVQQVLKRHEVYKKIQTELGRRQKGYVKRLLLRLKTCGVMIHKVPAKVRHKFVEDMPVVFAIMKYGKEGLDSPALDTILVSTPFSSRNALQQVMGRPARTHAGKKKPLVIFYEDNIGLLIGMCQKLRKHLRDWPHEEGGPYEYEQVGYHQLARRQWTPQVFGQ
jgi:superfamily II DNA or RNA helicase